MAFALKASASSAALGHPQRRDAAGAAAVTVPTRSMVRAVAAATSGASIDPAVAMSTPGRFVVRAPRVPSLAHVPVADRPALSVAQTLSKIKEQGKTAFIPYITAGDPDLETTAEALRLLEACGADVIELDMPFSNPYADGPVIQASAARALAGRTTIDAVLSMLKEVTPELSCPVVLFSYLRLRGIKNRLHVHDRYMDHLRAHGLLSYSKLTSSNEKFLLDPSLMSALVDRWRPETHTFQLRCEELTPTLKDVSMITAFPIIGNPMVPQAYSSNWPLQVEARLGVPFPVNTRSGNHPRGVPLSWIVTHFANLPANADNVTLAQHLFAYVLYLLGIMFPSSRICSSTRICSPVLHQRGRQITHMPSSWL